MVSTMQIFNTAHQQVHVLYFSTIPTALLYHNTELPVISTQT